MRRPTAGRVASRFSIAVLFAVLLILMLHQRASAFGNCGLGISWDGLYAWSSGDYITATNAPAWMYISWGDGTEWRETKSDEPASVEDFHFDHTFPGPGTYDAYVAIGDVYGMCMDWNPTFTVS